MEATILGSAGLSIFINFKGYAQLLWGSDAIVDEETGSPVVPQKDEEDAEEVNEEA